MQAVVLLESGLHNPVAAAIGGEGESELVRALRLVLQLMAQTREVDAPFLARVRQNLKARVQQARLPKPRRRQVLRDGSALVELIWRDETGHKHTLLVREVTALVARTLERAAALVTPARRARSCPRAVRQPVGSWPRLLRQREWKGESRHEIIAHRESKSQRH